MITNSINKAVKWTLCLALFTIHYSLLTSCSDFFEQDSEHVIFTDEEHLNNATDSIYSVTGILNKLQALADRTILLGEVRGDLVDLTSVASSDLRDLALFNVGDDNQYNQPRDYYAVINNCNYFIAHVDTALRNNRNEYIFMKEYAAVKAIRAWTYLQLVLNYGSVPFVTNPVLTKQEAEAEYPRYDLKAVCEYFINDLADIPEEYNRSYPGYGSIRSTDSRLFYFPLSIIRGELNIWAGNYREAALNYYKYISQRNGTNSTYPQGLGIYTWMPGSTTWMSTRSYNPVSFSSESYGNETELITMIPCDSIRAEGNYSELRNLFNSREDNDYKVSITPSNGLVELSESQAHCCLGANGTSFYYAPQGLDEHRSGDLRLSDNWSQSYTRDKTTGERIETQFIFKYQTRNIHIYRRQMVYLRMAEALNMAGFPRMAFKILSEGVNNTVIRDEVMPFHSQADSAFLAQFDFPASRYGIFDVEDMAFGRVGATHNTTGIHTRGSGWTPCNEFYRMPGDTLVIEQDDTLKAVKLLLDEQLRATQQQVVDSLILNESALEFAFEGTRYYDIMRHALRQPNPGQFMASHIWQRRGKDNVDAVRSELRKDLTQTQNWYLQWNGKIGF